MANWINATVVDKRRWTSGLFSLQFEADIAPFKAGQFLRIGMDIDGERVGRPYSLINAPEQRPYEIHFNIVPEGPLSPRLAELGRGDKVWTHDTAHGFLVLDEVPDVSDLWMLSTGTAVGPFLSILNTDVPWQRFKHIVLAYAVRTADAFCYQDTINKILQDHPTQFQFVPFVSREVVADTIHGRIPASITDQQLETTTGLILDLEHSHVMLCGNSGMIEDTTKVLKERGMKRHRRTDPGHITTEKYY